MLSTQVAKSIKFTLQVYTYPTDQYSTLATLYIEQEKYVKCSDISSLIFTKNDQTLVRIITHCNGIILASQLGKVNTKSAKIVTVISCSVGLAFNNQQKNNSMYVYIFTAIKILLWKAVRPLCKVSI